MKNKKLQNGDMDGTDTEKKNTAIPRPDISVSQIILVILAQTGRASFDQILRHSFVRSLGAIRSENSFYTALARLKRRRFIIRTPDRGYELTPLGEYAALKAYVRKEFTETERDMSFAPTPSKTPPWDGRWRMVLFDIPENKRPLRDYIRNVLKRQGFKEFQRSMWIYPHKLPAFMSRLFGDPQMRRYARVITTYDIDYDEDLRRRFKLL